MRLPTYGNELAQTVDVRRAATGFAVTVAALAALGLAEHAGASLTPFDLDHDFSLPSLLTGFLMLAAGGLAALLARHGSRGLWTVAALTFAGLGVEELLYAHQRLEARADLTWTTSFLPIVVVAGIVWLATTRSIRSAQARTVVLAAAATWLVAQALEGAFVNDTFAVAVVKPVLDLVAAGALVLGLVIELRERLGAPGARRSSEVLDEYVRGIRPASAGAATAALIALLAIGGSLVGGEVLAAYFLDLNGEQTLPAAFSGALLFVAAALALLLQEFWPLDAHGRRWWLVLGLVFAALGVDEIGALHEKIQEATGIHPGQLVLAPLVIVAGLAWLVALRRMPSAASRNLWLGGAALWVLSQAVDATQPPNRFVWSVVPEEALEMAGSALFALALLVALRDRPGLSDR